VDGTGRTSGPGRAGGASTRARRGLAVAVAAAGLLVIAAVVAVATHLWPAANGSPDHAGHAAHPAGSARSAAAASRAPTASPASPGPLAGQVVGIDPGHNGRNGADPAYINRLIWNGREEETCDTTGTQTDGGYPEARFTFNVAGYLRADLVREGARVVMTRTSDDGVGPCVNTRAEILNDAHAGVAIDIHADGGPPWGRGFTVLEPVADGPNDKVIGASLRFGGDVRAAMISGTSMPVSDYYGQHGFEPRDDLAGLNLTTVPKVLIECGNMRNAADARLLVSAPVQQQIAAALAAAITSFLAPAA
jgi:N-acetylmuramoyl-L-alanine amidase